MPADSFQLLQSYVDIGTRGVQRVFADVDRIEARLRAISDVPDINVRVDVQGAVQLQRQLSALNPEASETSFLLNQIAFSSSRQSIATRQSARALTEQTAVLNRMESSLNRVTAAQARNTTALAAGAGRSNSLLPLLTRSVGGFVGAYLTLEGLKRVSIDSILKAAELDNVRVSLEALTGSVEGASRIFDEINSLETIFPIGDLRSGVRLLINAGIAADDAVGDLVRLQKVAAAGGGDLQRLLNIYTQVAQKGRLFSEEILQFAENQIPIVQLLAKTYGLTAAEIRELTEEGAINFDVVRNAIIQATDAGGRFGDVIAERADTVGGKVVSLQNSWTRLQESLGQAAGPTTIRILDSLSNQLDDIRIKIIENDDLPSKLGAIYEAFSATNPAIIAVNQTPLGEFRKSLIGDISQLPPVIEDIETLIGRVEGAFARLQTANSDVLRESQAKAFADDLKEKFKSTEETIEDFEFKLTEALELGGLDPATADRAIADFQERLAKATRTPFVERLEKDAERITQAVETPLESLERQLQDLRLAFDFTEGALSTESAQRQAQALTEEYLKAEVQLRRVREEALNLGDTPILGSKDAAKLLEAINPRRSAFSQGTANIERLLAEVRDNIAENAPGVVEVEEIHIPVGGL